MLNVQAVVRNQCGDVPESLVAMHFRRCPEPYWERFSAAETARHVKLLGKLTGGQLAAVEFKHLGGTLYEATVAGVDLTGVLACITGAIAADGFSVQDLQLFSWTAPPDESGEPTYFIDVLRVTGSLRGQTPAQAADMLTHRLQRGFEHLAQGNFADAHSSACDSKIRALGEASRNTPGRGTPTGATPIPLEGQVLGSDFRLLRRIAAGGMSQIYLGQQISLNRQVAIKIVLGGDASGEQLLERIAREAAVLGRCNSPHIVQVLATGRGTLAGNRPMHWLAMEYLPGGDLAQRIQWSGPPPIEQGVRWLRQSLEALSHAHRQGVLHRDLKPHNLLLTEEGDVKVADFGLVKQIRDTGDLSASGVVVGTPHYMSPEQATGEPVDERSDIYSLGATFFHIISGRLPFDKRSLTAVLVAISQQQAPPRLAEAMPAAPKPLEVILGRMLARAPDERYQDVRVALEDLASYEARGLLRAADSGMFHPSAAQTNDPTRWTMDLSAG